MDAESSVYQDTVTEATNVDEIMLQVEGNGEDATLTADELMRSASQNLVKSAQNACNNVKYAAIVNNVTFTYGCGKKAKNVLNNITLKVPVGNM